MNNLGFVTLLHGCVLGCSSSVHSKCNFLVELALKNISVIYWILGVGEGGGGNID